MRKKDFKKGQTVFIKDLVFGRIKKVKILKVGTIYLTIDFRNVKFRIEDLYCMYSSDLKLYLSMQQIKDEQESFKIKKFISNNLKDLQLKNLMLIEDIIKQNGVKL